MIEPIRNQRRWHRALTLFLVLALLLPVTVAFSAGGSGPDADSPTLTLVATGVDETYVEVGLNVNAQKSDGASFNNFRSAGAVLTYNAGLLQPVEWETDALVELPETPGWAGAAPLHTKGPDMLSGKTALAYVVDKVGYLCLMAEAPRTMSAFSQSLPSNTPLVDGTTLPILTAAGLPVLVPAEEVIPPEEPDPTPDPSPEASPDPTPDPAAAVTDPDPAVSDDPTPDPDPVPVTKLETPVEQVVVTRFKLAEGADLAAAIASIDLVKGSVAEDSFLYDAAGASYYPGATAADPAAAGESVPVNLQLLRVENGTTYFTGGGGTATADGFAGITLYDWDDTLLGSLVVPKGSDATAAVKQFVQERSATAEQLAGGLFYADETLPFTNKRGYSFDMETYGVWLEYSSETLTHYGSEVQGVLLPKPDAAAGAVDLTKVEGNLILKACYGANDELIVSSGDSGRYTTEVLSTVRDLDNNFLIEMEVYRQNQEKGIQRLGKPAVKITYTLSTGGTASEILTLTNIGNSDIEKFNLAANLNMTEYTAAVIDIYEFPTWTAAGNKSVGNGDVYGSVENNLIAGGNWVNGGSYTANGFVYKGTLNYINELLASGKSASINQTLLDSIHLNYSMLMPPVPVIQVINASNNINKAYQELNQNLEEGEKPKSLTYKQMQYAIVSDGVLLTSNID